MVGFTEREGKTSNKANRSYKLSPF